MVSELCSAPQPLGEDTMSGGRGMDTIGGPVLWRALARKVVERPLQRYERRFRALGDALGGGAALLEFRKPAIVHRAASTSCPVDGVRNFLR